MNPPIIRRAPSGIMATACSREIVCKAHSPVPQRPRPPWRRCQSARRRGMRPSEHTPEKSRGNASTPRAAARDLSAPISPRVCADTDGRLSMTASGPRCTRPAQSWPIRPDHRAEKGEDPQSMSRDDPHVHGGLLRAAAHSAHDRGRDVGGKRPLRLPGPRKRHRQADHLARLWTVRHNLCCLSARRDHGCCLRLCARPCRANAAEGGDCAL